MSGRHFALAFVACCNTCGVISATLHSGQPFCSPQHRKSCKPAASKLARQAAWQLLLAAVWRQARAPTLQPTSGCRRTEQAWQWLLHRQRRWRRNILYSNLILLESGFPFIVTGTVLLGASAEQLAALAAADEQPAYRGKQLADGVRNGARAVADIAQVAWD